MKAYPAYKPSGVEWLGEVPEGWEVCTVQSLAAIINGYPFDSSKFSNDEGAPLIRIRDLGKAEAETRYTGDIVEGALVTSDDVLIGMDGDFNVGRWHGAEPALLNQRLCCLRTNHPVISRYLEYCLSFPLNRINDLTYATTVKHLSSYQVQKIRIAIPRDVAERAKITAFLDREVAKIDGLIEEQRRLIALLAEKRQATISHAVTKGLNPNAKFKPSGIDWLGDVPEEWEVGPLKRFWSVTDCKHITADFTDVGIPLASIREVQSRFVDLSEAKLTTIEFYNELIEGGRKPESGDLIFSRNASVGEVAQVPIGDKMFAMGQDVCLLKKLDRDFSTEFFYAFLKSRVIAEQLSLLMIGSTFKRINVEAIRNLVVLIPSPEEQISISGFLDEIWEEYDSLSQAASETIILLQERRSALISAAVTGKIDVRDVAPDMMEPA